MRDIYKSAGIIIKDKKLLVIVESPKDKNFYIAPGGRVDEGETDIQTLIRELNEELQIDVSDADLEEFGKFSALAAGMEDTTVHMTVFTVNKWAGEPTPDNEVEEIAWVTSKNEQNLPLGSIFEHEVIPRLKEKGLIE